MSTPHNRANPGDFAKTVLMPGDPLRAKFIAETFLENPRLVTDVRGMLGYTGTYQGHPVSVMGGGMGMPSIGIYSYELYHFYGVENIIRVGTAGGMSEPGSARVTRTFLPSFHCTYSGSSRKAYPDNKVIWQGVYGQYRAGYNDFHIGTLWFNEASAALAGKTIHQATLSLRRSNGGSSAARNVYLGAVALRQADWATTYRPAFTAPTALPAYPAGQLSRECEGVYDITSLMAAVQQGYGIGVYEPCAAYSGSYSPHYTMFYGLGSDFVPVLTVTYS